jgi:hypothetical protein
MELEKNPEIVEFAAGTVTSVGEAVSTPAPTDPPPAPPEEE